MLERPSLQRQDLPIRMPEKKMEEKMELRTLDPNINVGF